MEIGKWRLRMPLPGRRNLIGWASLAAIVLVVIAAVLSLRGEPGTSGSAKYAGLELRLLDKAIEPARQGQVLTVTGEIINRTPGVMKVPALRISLRSGGTERYSWFVEPAVTRLVGGRSVVIRSVLAAPPTGIDEVVFGFAERRDTIIGMR